MRIAMVGTVLMQKIVRVDSQNSLGPVNLEKEFVLFHCR